MSQRRARESRTLDLEFAPVEDALKGIQNRRRVIAVGAQELNSLNPSLMSFSVGASSPSLDTTRATAAEAWALE